MLTDLIVRTVPAADLLGSGVNMRFRGGQSGIRHSTLDIRLDERRVDPAAIPAILAEGRRALTELAAIKNELATLVPVRCYLERDMPDGKLVACEISPWQIDLHIARGLMPADLVREYAGHSTRILRTLRRYM